MSHNYIVKAYWDAKSLCGSRVKSRLKSLHEYKIPKQRVYSLMSSAIGERAVSLFRKRLRLGEFQDISLHELILFESIVIHLVACEEDMRQAELVGGLFL